MGWNEKVLIGLLRRIRVCKEGRNWKEGSSEEEEEVVRNEKMYRFEGNDSMLSQNDT